MNQEELAELMAEGPGGDNHGRVRTEGGWRSLEPHQTQDLPYVISDPAARPRTAARHGTRSRYVNRGCRCSFCREANRRYIAARRTAERSDPADSLLEEDQ